ncbi:hypothetical protein [Streptomyces sp. NPDC085479]|uniref:hypothetical protein n=1 Tax=Streptomyces sp. NPDC085479 TaxID=3365726 RepID=UPI0037CCC4D1
MELTARNTAIVTAAAAALLGAACGGALTEGPAASGDISVVGHSSIWSVESGAEAADETAESVVVTAPTTIQRVSS